MTQTVEINHVPEEKVTITYKKESLKVYDRQMQQVLAKKLCDKEQLFSIEFEEGNTKTIHAFYYSKKEAYKAAYAALCQATKAPSVTFIIHNPGKAVKTILDNMRLTQFVQHIDSMRSA